MRFASLIAVTLMFPFMLALPAQAQDDEEPPIEPIHPALSSRFQVGLGGFWPEKDLELRVNGNVPGNEIEFDERVGISDDDNGFAGLFRWRFGEKWSFQAQYFKLESDGSATLEEDVTFQDVVFKEGSFVAAGFDLTVARLFFGRTFSTGPRHEFGLGLGVHWLELGAFIEGDVQTSEGGTDFLRADANADFPMPNIGAWYYYAFNEQWLLNLRLDWLDVSFDRYSGGLWNGLIGIQWNPHPNWGIGASFNNFGLDGSITDTDWRGTIDYSAYGPLLTVTTNWGRATDSRLRSVNHAREH